MILYGLRTCDACRKALKSLPDADFRDVRAEGVPADVLNSAYNRYGTELINTRSTTWRSLDEAERTRDTLDLLTEHPVLMKRPLIEAGGMLYLGWSREVQAELLG